MGYKYLKLLLFSFIIGVCIVSFDSFFIRDGLSETLSPELFFAVLVVCQLIYLPLFEQFRSVFERIFYSKGTEITKKINSLSLKLNTISKFSELISVTDGIFNQSLNYSQPLIYLFYEDYGFVNSVYSHKGTVLSETELTDFSKELQLYSTEELPADIRNVIDCSHYTEFAVLQTDNICVGIAFIPITLSKYLHIDALNTALKRFLQKFSDLSIKTHLFDELHLQLVENKLLTAIGAQLTSSLELKEVLTTILDGLKQLIHYDAVGIFLNGTTKSSEKLITKGYNEDALKEFEKKNAEGIIHWVYQNNKPVVVPDVSQNNYYYRVRENTQSQITVPLTYKGSVLGTFTLESDKLNQYTEKSLQLLLPFAEQASIAITNAQLYKDAKQKMILEEEMIHAGKIQQAILPRRIPPIAHLDSSLFTKPCKFVGGDIHDFVRLSDHELLFAIGDVSGKGTPAGILTAILFAGLRSELRRQLRPNMSELNARLNNLLFNVTSSGVYATFFLGYYDSLKNKFYYSNAGHNPPILIKKDHSSHELMTGGMVLGFLDNESYQQESTVVEPGDILVLFTDGLNEAFDRNDEEFGEEKIISVVKKYSERPAHQIKERLVSAVIAHHGKQQEFDDDITLIVLKF